MPILSYYTENGRPLVTFGIHCPQAMTGYLIDYWLIDADYFRSLDVAYL